VLGVRLGVVQALGADVVGRVDHDAPVQRRAVLGQQIRHRAARHRQQHDLRRGDRVRDGDRLRRLRRARSERDVVPRTPPRRADRRADVAAPDDRDARHGRTIRGPR